MTTNKTVAATVKAIAKKASVEKVPAPAKAAPKAAGTAPKQAVKKPKKMPKVKIDLPAPDFTRADHLGNTIRLQDFREKSNVILVFNRGFV